MDKYDLLEAMGGIRDRYIEDAGLSSAADPEKAASEPAASSQGNNPGHRKAAGRKVRKLPRWSTFAAALLCVSIILPNLLPGITSVFSDVPLLNRYFTTVTFRKTPAQESAAESQPSGSGILAMGSDNPETLSPEEGAAYEAEEAYDQAYDDSESNDLSPRTYKSGSSENQKSTQEQDAASSDQQPYDQVMPMMGNPDLSDSADESALYAEGNLSLQAALSEADLSEDVRDKAQAYISDFEKYISEETGYESLSFVHEKVAETEDRLSISVTSCTEEDDNYLQTNHFVIDKSTGQIITLHSLFESGVDYVTPLSENIKEQMKKEMEEDPYIQYRLDSAENTESNFKTIKSDQDYYINDDGNLVICFDIEEVAPLYMGAAEFTIPQEITDPLLSK